MEPIFDVVVGTRDRRTADGMVWHELKLIEPGADSFLAIDLPLHPEYWADALDVGVVSKFRDAYSNCWFRDTDGQLKSITREELAKR